MADSIRLLSLDEAALLFEGMAHRVLPATLHPRYLAADAKRVAALDCWFLAYESGGEKWLHGIHSTRIEGTSWRDASSPYGYGGPVSTSAAPQFQAAAWRAYENFMREAGVVVEFVRFHPVAGNDAGYPGKMNAGRTVVTVDISDANFAAFYPPRLQQTIRKAAKAGVVYEESDFTPHATRFGKFHRAAMAGMGADPFYVFADNYFVAMGATGRARLGVCKLPAAGAAEDAWLAAALFLDGGGVREYHLAASTEEGRRSGAASLLLHQAALRARDEGRRHLYLGGGTDAKEDNPLLFFKGAFSPLRLSYRTGWRVFDASAYEALKLRFAAGWAAHPERAIFWRKV